MCSLQPTESKFADPVGIFLARARGLDDEFRNDLIQGITAIVESKLREGELERIPHTLCIVWTESCLLQQTIDRHHAPQIVPAPPPVSKVYTINIGVVGL